MSFTKHGRAERMQNFFIYLSYLLWVKWASGTAGATLKGALAEMLFTKPALVLLLILFSTAESKSETVKFKNYSVADGLANSTVYFIFQDTRGFMWLATESGVNRFDGQRFELFTMDHGLSDNEVLKIQEDSRGRIWFLTLNGKLSYFYKNKFYNPVNDATLRKAVSAGSFVSFFEDTHHNIWLSTNENLILKIGTDNSVHFYQSEYKSFSNCYINQTADGNILAFSKEDIFMLKDGNFAAISAKYLPLSPKSVMNSGRDSTLMFLSAEGIVEYKNRGFRLGRRLQGIENISAGNFLIDNLGKLWLSSMGKGIFIFTDSGLSRQNYLKDQTITHIMKDFQGNIWVSTVGKGVFMLPFYSRHSTHLTTEDGLSSNVINSVIKVRDRIILGLRNGNLDIVSPSGISHKYFGNADVYNPVKRLQYDKDRGSIWYASDKNLMEIHPGQGKANILSDKSRGYALKSFSTNNNGQIALALASGVYVTDKDVPLLFDSRNGGSRHPHFANRAFTVFYDSSGRLWFSNIDGLQYYEGGRVVSLYKRFPKLKQRITDIAELPDHTLICTTYGFGVFVLKNNRLLKTITTRNGLSSNICKRVFLDGSKAWIVTGKGISRIQFSKDASEIKNFDTESGLISNEINDIFVDKDTVYVASNDGLSIFMPSLNSSLRPAPRLYLRAMLANKMPFAAAVHTALPFNQNNITVNFIGLDYSHPSHLLYSYRINHSQKWNETAGTSIEFGSLEPGTYKLEIRVKSLNTSWSKPILTVFTIKPPFWKTWWFLALAILSFGIALFFLIRNYFRAKQSEEKEKLLVKTRIISLEQQALQAMMNPHFIFNVMNSIQYFINTKENTMANQVLTGFARLIRKNLDICNKSYISVEEEVNYLTLYLSLEKLRFGDKMSYKIEVDKNINLQETTIPSMLLQPYVENAIWHGIMPKDSPGTITVAINKSHNYLNIRICDDGIGIENSVSSKQSEHISRGMNLTLQRINLLNKYKPRSITIRVQQIAEGGTEVAIDVPLKPFTN